MSGTSSTSLMPLSGLRVLDMSRILAGPYATQILGDLGADVLKIEQPGKGDDTRRWGPPFAGDTAVYYHTANRNKRSRVLDFTKAEDKRTLWELLGQADVLVENFKVGTLAKMGLDDETLQRDFPRLVVCSITGFGQTGPRAEEPGYDALIQAMGGLMSITGPTSDQPTKVGVALTDLMTGLYAAIAILAALRERDRSGLGQRCDLSLLDTQVASLANVAMNFLATGVVPRAMGNAHPTIVPYQSFPTADEPLMVAIGNDSQFASFCEVLGVPWHMDERFATNAQRVRHRSVLVALVEERLRQEPRHVWLARFEGAAFPSGPVNDLEAVARDPQVIHRDMFTTMDDGVTPCLRSPLRFSRTPIVRYGTPPGLGEHADATFEKDEAWRSHGGIPPMPSAKG